MPNDFEYLTIKELNEICKRYDCDYCPAEAICDGCKGNYLYGMPDSILQKLSKKAREVLKNG